MALGLTERLTDQINLLKADIPPELNRAADKTLTAIRVQVGDSIDQAIALSRTSENKVITFASGIHFINKTIELYGIDSGLTVTAEDGAILSGGTPIKPLFEWSADCGMTSPIKCIKLHNTGILNGLFHNGNRMIRAR